MKILTIGTDKTLFESGAPAQRRILDYGTLATELHIIVYTAHGDVKNGLTSQGDAPSFMKIGRNVFVYPTESKSKKAFFRDAFIIGKHILSRKDKERATDVTSGKRTNAVLRSIYKGLDTSSKKYESSWLISTQDPFETAAVGVRLKKMFKAPLQIQVHTDFLSKYFWKESFKNKYRVLLAERMIKKADCVRVVSERIKASLRKTKLVERDVPIAVLPIFVEKPDRRKAPIVDGVKPSASRTVMDFKTLYPTFETTILMASRFTQEKNISLAIQAMRRIVKKYPKTLLVIVGDGPMKEQLQHEAKALSQNVVFLPWANNLGPYYGSADVFLSTSDYEGYGRTLVEAELYGLPVVTTDVGCAGDVIRHEENGLVVKPKDVRGLTQALTHLIEDSDMLQRLQRNTKGIVSRLQEKNEYLEVYRKSWLLCLPG